MRIWEWIGEYTPSYTHWIVQWEDGVVLYIQFNGEAQALGPAPYPYIDHSQREWERVV